MHPFCRKVARRKLRRTHPPSRYARKQRSVVHRRRRDQLDGRPRKSAPGSQSCPNFAGRLLPVCAVNPALRFAAQCGPVRLGDPYEAHTCHAGARPCAVGAVGKGARRCFARRRAECFRSCLVCVDIASRCRRHRRSGPQTADYAQNGPARRQANGREPCRNRRPRRRQRSSCQSGAGRQGNGRRRPACSGTACCTGLPQVRADRRHDHLGRLRRLTHGIGNTAAALLEPAPKQS